MLHDSGCCVEEGAPAPAGTSVLTKHNWDMGMGYLCLNGCGIYDLISLNGQGIYHLMGGGGGGIYGLTL